MDKVSQVDYCACVRVCVSREREREETCVDACIYFTVYVCICVFNTLLLAIWDLQNLAHSSRLTSSIMSLSLYMPLYEHDECV